MTGRPQATVIESRTVGYPGSYADIGTIAEQAGKIIFTLYWPAKIAGWVETTRSTLIHPETEL